MDILEVEQSLPYGFHDAILNDIHINYETRKVRFNIEVLLDEDEYKKGDLIISDLNFISIDPPDKNYEFINKELFLTAGKIDDLDKDVIEKIPKNELPENSFIHWFFVSAWNSFIIFSAIDAEFVWKPHDLDHR
jgi:hypothetical protein